MPTQHETHPTTSPPPANAADIVCPYCGERQPPSRACRACRGVFEPLSRQASQNAMGPWQLRDEAHPFRPGCSYDTLRVLVARGRVTRDSVLRGPTTNQFWTIAARVPGVAHLLGLCHSCGVMAKPADRLCQACGAVFDAPNDRQRLGLAPMLPLDAVGSEDNGAARVDRPTLPGAIAKPAAAAATASPHIFEHFQPATSAHARRGRSAGRAALIGLIVIAPLVVVAAVTLRPTLIAGSPVESDGPVPLEPTPAQASGDARGPAEVAAALEGSEQAGAGSQAEAATSPLEVRVRAILDGADESTPEGVQAALDSLRGLRDEVPTSGRPEGLDTEISRLERRLEELLLRRMLGGGERPL